MSFSVGAWLAPNELLVDIWLPSAPLLLFGVWTVATVRSTWYWDIGAQVMRLQLCLSAVASLIKERNFHVKEHPLAAPVGE